MLNFLGIGAQKAGTTWLFERLHLHPAIYFPGGKEVHFWDQHYAKGVGWYRSLFENESLTAKTCGDITPAYAILAPELIKECHENFPELKLIYIIRNPIERAWSSAKMALSRAEMQIEEASDQWFIDHFRSRGSMMRGDYEACLRNWLRFYRGDQILTCLFDSLASEPHSVLSRCFAHLGVPAGDYPLPADLSEKIFSTTPEPLPHNLRGVLSEIYAPRIESLQDYLGLDLSGWR
jgi:hypothetical protein